MKKNVSALIGFGLLALCFALALGRMVSRNASSRQTEAGRITLRFAHWQLENGPREAFDRIADEYMRLHPEIQVVQLPIPERIYTNWLITQLVGQTAPDLIQIGITSSDERLARFFTPLAAVAVAPNPYNKGTVYEGVPLRETLFDGMEGGYSRNLFDYYGVPVSGFTIRMFYNTGLLEQITGSAQLPGTYEEMLTLCRQVQDYSKRTGVPIVPIAGSRYNGPMLLTRLFSAQTQTLAHRLNPVGVMGEDSIRRAADYLDGRWTLDSPEVRAGFDLMREVSQFMQPGFFQLQRDDATLLFVQQRAVMICTGSWDATSIRQQADFPIGVGPIPFPSTENSTYGRYTFGSLSEAGTNGGIVFGVTRHSKNSDAAKDFLQFLSSHRMSQLWTDVSGWIPAVVDTDVDEKVAPFLPITQGELPGFSPTIGSGGDGVSFPDVRRAYLTNLYRLIAPTGSTSLFVDLMREEYSRSIFRDMQRQLQTTVDLLQRNDTQGTALAWHAKTGNRTAQARYEEFLQSSSLNERKYFRTWLALQLKDSPSR